MSRGILIALLFLCGCSWHPSTREYQRQYAHLTWKHTKCNRMRPSDYFIIFLVDARRLDYSDNLWFVKTLVKHPSDGSKNGDVGHAWVYIEGNLNGRRVYLEGGHTYSREHCSPQYLAGITQLSECGHPNPASYLWYVRPDGFFEQGNGGHIPTYAAKVDLTEEQFLELVEWIEHYPYDTYALQGPQCATVVTEIAGRVGIDLENRVTLPIDQKVYIGGAQYVFWQDPKYSSITFGSPDRLERSLMQAVLDGEAEYALIWYLNLGLPVKKDWRNDLFCLPERIVRQMILLD